jgi:DNA-binding XRE family transcriptional regulator
MNPLGQQLRNRRRLAEVSTVVMAKRLGISRQTLWLIEHDEPTAKRYAYKYRKALRDGNLTSEVAS